MLIRLPSALFMHFIISSIQCTKSLSFVSRTIKNGVCGTRRPFNNKIRVLKQLYHIFKK